MNKKLDEIIQRLEQIDERLALIESIISPTVTEGEHHFEGDVMDFFKFILGTHPFFDGFEGWDEN